MPSSTRVLVVDSDAVRGRALVERLAPAGFESSLTALVDTPGIATDVVLLSTDAPDAGTITRIAASIPDADLVVVTRARTPAVTRDALRGGACDVVGREEGVDMLCVALERAAREGRYRRELAMLRVRVGDDARRALVGNSPSMTLVRELVGRAAGSRRTVLVTGESGTGKSIVARLLHDLSDRAGRPFVVARCDGGDPAALDAELFGTEREGLLETARGGTLVLEEVRALPLTLYTRLATMLAERVVRRPGAERAQPIDVRLVLTVRTAEGEATMSAHELFDDRNVLPIALPPLRERRRDIPMLVQHFRERLPRGSGELPPIGAETMAPLLAHHWPGNVRELEHWVDRIGIAAHGDAGRSARRAVVAPGAEFAPQDQERLTLDALERRYILHVLAREGGHQSRAADRLGIDRRTLYRKLKEYRDDGVAVRIAG